VSKTAVAPAEVSPSRESVVEELERVAQSATFRKAARCLRLLRYIVQASLVGRTHELKEYTLGVQVFDRPQNYDPRTEPVVRLEARRLRLKLAEYYQSEGSKDPIVIDLPKGGYVPEFRVASGPAIEPAAVRVKNFEFTNRHALALGAALVLVAVAIGGLASRTKTPAVTIRPSIAVIGFRDVSQTAQTAWISTAFADRLNFDLAAGQQLRTVPLENVARMRTELALQPQTTYSVELLQRMRKNVGTDYVVAGALSDQANHLQANVIVMDARTGQPLTAIREDAPDNDLEAIAQRGAARIRALLGVRSPATSLPAFDERALEPYARGMERLREGDALGARAYLEQAASESPSNPFVHAGLAAALAATGLDHRAEQEAKKALDSSAELGRVEQLEIEGRYATMARDWERATRVYQALFTLFPDDLEYGLLLAFSETRAGQAKQAFGVLKSLRSLPSPLGDDPRIDMTEAQAAGALSDFKLTEEKARAAAEKARARGAGVQYAKARLLQSGAMQTLGEKGFAEIRAEARNICAELGERSCVAAAYRVEANEKATAGELAAADRLYSASLKIADEIGNRFEELNALNGLAYTSLQEGDLRAAEASLRRAAVIGAEMGTQQSYQIILSLAEVLADEGRLGEARKLVADAEKTANQVSEQNGIAHAQSATAHVLALENRPSEALTKYAAAVATLRSLNDAFDLRDTLLEFADVQLQYGNIAGARKSFEEARALYPKFGHSWTPELKLAFADLSLAEGHLSDAVTHAQSALESCTNSGRQGDRLRAAAILARAWLRQEKSSDAFALIARFPAPDTRKVPPRSIVDFQIARSLVLAEMGKRAEAVRVIEETINLSARAGIPQLQDRAVRAKKSLAVLN
jgi:TolB-like protein/Tfp pilus assembly protein PilF